jgi:ABC-type antimicrobial peptide transport system permease subunit
MAYIVEQRTQEIGVRMALGAQPGQMLRMILTRAGALMSLGLVIGLGAGWMLSRLVATFLFQVEAHDPLVFVAAGAALMLAGLVAAFVPARRAAHVDPLLALRS